MAFGRKVAALWILGTEANFPHESQGDECGEPGAGGPRGESDAARDLPGGESFRRPDQRHDGPTGSVK